MLTEWWTFRQQCGKTLFFATRETSNVEHKQKYTIGRYPLGSILTMRSASLIALAGLGFLIDGLGGVSYCIRTKI